MAEEQYHKSNIARAFLETAVVLYLSGNDKSSVITLASDASNIFERLVRNQGKEPFVDYACRVHGELIGLMPKRGSYSHHIRKRLGIVAHQHMSEDDSDTIELDLEKCAFDALSMAIKDYTTLYGQDEKFVKAFLQFAWETTDGKSMMEDFDKIPDRLKPK